MATIPASEFYAKVVSQPFDKHSYTKDLEGGRKTFSFNKGANTVKVLTLDTTGALSKHNKDDTIATQFGKITNGTGEYNTYVLDQSYDIGKFIDKEVLATNSVNDVAAQYLTAIVAEQLIPKIDAYRIGVLSATAATTGQEVSASSDGYADFLSARTMLLNAREGQGNLVAYAESTFTNSLRLSKYFVPNTNGLEKSMRSGSIGEIAGFKVIEAPADLFAENTPVVLVNANRVITPRFLNDQKVTQPDISFGTLILGLYVFTCVVEKPHEKAVATIKTA